MSKLRQWKEAEDQRLAEDAAQRALNERIVELVIHPLVRANCDRNLREAYFYGLVYAGICDDLKIDETEEHLLNTIGAALALDVDFVMEAMTHMCEVENAAKMDLFAESLGVLKGLAPESLQHLFASEFIKVRMLHPENEPDLPADLKDIGEGLGVSLESDLDIFTNVVKAGSVATLAEIEEASALLGDEIVKYLVVHEMGCIDDAVGKFRNDRAVADEKRKEQDEYKRTLPERLVAIIEDDATWPVEFESNDYKPLFAAAGISEADAASFVARELLPYMQRVYALAMGIINNVHRCHEDICGCERHGVQLDTSVEFRTLFRYAKFMNVFLGLEELTSWYRFGGPVDQQWQYCCSDNDNLDRLSIDGWSISDQEHDRYVLRWTKVFDAIYQKR